MCSWGILFYNLIAPTHYDPANRLARKDAYSKALKKLEAAVPPESVGLRCIGTPAPVPIVPEAFRLPVRTTTQARALRPGDPH